MSRFERTPGAALGPAILDALYADISESSAAASKWDPLQRPKPNPEADISKASREPDVGAPPYSPKGELPDDTESFPRTMPGPPGIKLNRSQEAAMRLVLERQETRTHASPTTRAPPKPK
ncbi:unnamed protein product [Durusdinium trenchii]|uniref:Uncharacterized protein n=1 Tax=Durusdinium trenchii TaxID=1381693 RepID=A0ABP0LU69_9DINO